MPEAALLPARHRHETLVLHGRGIEDAQRPQSPPERMARCYCGKVVPTALVRNQGMFEDLGPTSRNATQGCICGLDRRVHDEARAKPPWQFEKCGGVFQARGARDFDSFYCGCSD